MNNIEEIKARIDIVDLVSESVKLRRTGKNHIGFCPFHSNTKTPAFVVFPETGSWRCFGECSEGGDIFKFVMKKEGWDFSEALKNLAKKAGIVLEPLTTKKKEENAYIEKLRKILEDAIIFFKHSLLSTEEGKSALAYLTEKRMLTHKTIEVFELGYAPKGWENLLVHLREKGYSPKELEDCGMITKRDKSDGFYDRFRNRIIFPIRDAYNKICGFGARALTDEDMPKYLNSPQTLLFDKSALLYGLDKARKPIRSNDQAVIVEGYFDVIGLHQAGFDNAVSPMGTAITPVQMRQLKRFSRRIVLALDPDAAGEKATMKGLEVARSTMDHSTDYVFDAKGLIKTEARLDADIRVCMLPEGKDPDEIVLEDKEQWNTILEKAKPIITHVIDTLTSQKDIEDPKSKSAIVNQVLPLIKDVPNAVERDAYRQHLARILKIDERTLFSLSEVQYVSGKKTRRRKTSEVSSDDVISSLKNKLYYLEKHLLHLMISKPEMIYDLDRYLKSNELPLLSSGDIESGDLQLIFEVIIKSLKQVELDAEDFIQEKLVDSFDWIITETENGIPEDISSHKLAGDLIRTLLNIRNLRNAQKIDSLLNIQTSSDTESSSEMNHDLQAELMKSIKMRAILDKALSMPFQKN